MLSQMPPYFEGGTWNLILFTSRVMNIGRDPRYCLLEGRSLVRSHGPALNCLSRRMLLGSDQHKVNPPLPLPVNPWIWITRLRAPVHSSAGILPAGRPLTRSLLIRKRGAKNRYHFPKIDCELLGAATQSPDYRTITSV